MGKVRFRCREMVQITFLDKNVVPGSTIYTVRLCCNFTVTYCKKVQ